MRDAVPRRKLEQVQRVDNVVAIVPGRLANQFADPDVRCEMQHGARTALRRTGLEARVIGEVADDQLGVAHRPA